jgi:DNA-binding transcriptional MerR regulator/effector-binding domain-containing protein
MFSIGEFAHLGGVSIRTLRHYDEIGLLRPARVDPYNGYRTYSAAQLGQLNRIVALKELGLPLAQVKRLMGGITLEELRGMLTLRRAQLEQELDERKDKLLGVEARLRYIATEGAMPADDIVAKKIAAQGAVVMSAPAPGWGAPNIVPVVNGLVEKFDQLGIRDQVTESGPRIIFYEYGDDNDVTVFLALPVAERPQSLPEPAQYLELPEIEVASTVRNGRAASIFPMVYQDLVRWAEEHGYWYQVLGREVWINEVDDVSQIDQQVFEIQLPFTRSKAAAG